MIRERWKAVSIELTEALHELHCEGVYDGVRAVFFWKSVALGHWCFCREELPLSPQQLANAASKAVAQAVGAYDLAEGFRSALPGLPEPLLIDPVGALRKLTDLQKPMAALEGSVRPLSSRPRLTLSVAVCTRERPVELARCLTSLMTSSERPDEILVIDNAPSSASTRWVAERFPGIRYYCEPTKGLSSARNAALAIASSDIVAFVDDDVCVHSDWIARIWRCFDTPNIMVATGLVLPAELETPAQMMFETFEFFHQGYRKRSFGAAYFELLRRKGVPVWAIGAGANMAIRRRAFEMGFQFDTRLGPGIFGGCGEDSEFWYSLLAGGWSCVYEPSACVFHYHRRELGALRHQVRQYMQGHVAALLIQFRKSRDFGNLRRLLFALPAEYCLLFLRLLATGFAADRRILLRGVLGCFSGLRALLHSKPAEIS
jgi:GT2 family glycosyltransferase